MENITCTRSALVIDVDSAYDTPAERVFAAMFVLADAYTTRHRCSVAELEDEVRRLEGFIDPRQAGDHVATLPDAVVVWIGDIASHGGEGAMWAAALTDLAARYEQLEGGSPRRFSFLSLMEILEG